MRFKLTVGRIVPLTALLSGLCLLPTANVASDNPEDRTKNRRIVIAVRGPGSRAPNVGPRRRSILSK